MSIVSTLVKARKLITPPSKWGKKNYACNRGGWVCEPENPDAYRFCIIGAVRRFENDLPDEEIGAERLLRALYKASPGPKPSIANWNDHSDHNEVLMVLDFAILLAKDEKL